MQATYPARYADKNGQELISINNDGKTLTMIIRGVQFQGTDFDCLEPTALSDPALLSSFTLNNGELCSCILETEIPVPVVTPLGEVERVLTVRLELGEPAPNGFIDREHLTLELQVEGKLIASKGWSGCFEDEMLDIQKQLPQGTYLKACINCAYSDYSPVGHGMYGSLACFRDNKNGYMSVKTKHDLFGIWKTMTEFVQETYLCPEFARRVPGTGYRG